MFKPSYEVEADLAISDIQHVKRLFLLDDFGTHIRQGFLILFLFTALFIDVKWMKLAWLAAGWAVELIYLNIGMWRVRVAFKKHPFYFLYLLEQMTTKNKA